MDGESTDYFDTHSEPVDRRIAVALSKLGLAMKHETWSQASEAGVSPTQAQILSSVHTLGALSGKELAERVGVSLPTISDSVRVLVTKGLVKKSKDPRHPRASLIAPTAKGRRVASEARTWPDFLVGALGALTDVEKTSFLTGLLKMIRELQEQGQIPTTRMCVTCRYFRPHAHCGPAPHHCAFVDAPMAETQLRVECPDHEDAGPEQRDETWKRLLKVV